MPIKSMPLAHHSVKALVVRHYALLFSVRFGESYSDSFMFVSASALLEQLYRREYATLTCSRSLTYARTPSLTHPSNPCKWSDSEQ
jgi:hypothetical protein